MATNTYIGSDAGPAPAKCLKMGPGPRIALGTLLLALLSTSAVADPQASSSTQANTRIESTPLTQTDRGLAESWALSDIEIQRYQSLMLGIRGSVSAETLSPIEVLGIHARDAAERRRYAELWARAMHDDAERILAFQRAYDEAFERLFGEQKLIDPGRLLGRDARAPQFGKQDRLLFFTTSECPACDSVFKKALAHIDSVAGIDVYFADAAGTSSAQIRAWARQQNIDTAWVRNRRVTLNQNGTALNAVDPQAGDPPLLYVRRDGVVTPVSYAEL